MLGSKLSSTNLHTILDLPTPVSPSRQTFSSLRAMVGQAAPSTSAGDAAQNDHSPFPARRRTHRQPDASAGSPPPPRPSATGGSRPSAAAARPPFWAARRRHLTAAPAGRPRFSSLRGDGRGAFRGDSPPSGSCRLFSRSCSRPCGGRKHRRLLPAPSSSASSSPMSIPRWPLDLKIMDQTVIA